MKTLYYFISYYGYGTYFVNEKAELVSFLNEDNGYWSSQHSKFLADFFGGKTVALKISPEVGEVNCDDEFDETAFFSSIKPEVVTALKKATKKQTNKSKQRKTK